MNNILSLLLGLTAWGLGIAAICRRQPGLSFGSFTACCVSLVFQFVEMYRRVELSDYAAIGDTIGAVLFAAAVLTAVTAALNAAALARRFPKSKHAG